MKNSLGQLTAITALLALMVLTACSNDRLSDYSEQVNRFRLLWVSGPGCPCAGGLRAIHHKQTEPAIVVSMAPRNWATGAPESCTTCPMTGGRRQVE